MEPKGCEILVRRRLKTVAAVPSDSRDKHRNRENKLCGPTVQLDRLTHIYKVFHIILYTMDRAVSEEGIIAAECFENV